MAVIEASSITTGMTISFRTHNPHDNVVWTGKVIALCDYDVAKLFTDVDTFHQEVVRSDPNTNYGSASELDYLVLEFKDNNANVIKQAFALPWLVASSIEAINEKEYIDIRVYSISSTKAQDLAAAIQSTYGYVAKVLE